MARCKYSKQPPEFEGFDLNNETDHYSIATFFVESLGRYSELEDVDLNSHCPTLHKYRCMLMVFNSYFDPLIYRSLTSSQLIEILNQ